MKKFNIVKKQFNLYNHTFAQNACYGAFNLVHNNINQASVWLIDDYTTNNIKVLIGNKWVTLNLHNKCVAGYYNNFIKPLIEKNDLKGRCVIKYSHNEYSSMQSNDTLTRRKKVKSITPNHKTIDEGFII